MSRGLIRRLFLRKWKVATDERPRKKSSETEDEVVHDEHVGKEARLCIHTEDAFVVDQGMIDARKIDPSEHVHDAHEPERKVDHEPRSTSWAGVPPPSGGITRLIEHAVAGHPGIEEVPGQGIPRTVKTSSHSL